MNLPRTRTWSGVFFSLFLAARISCPAAEPPRPNFVIIFTDDQGYQDVSCFGSPDIKTENLDRMAVSLELFHWPESTHSAHEVAWPVVIVRSSVSQRGQRRTKNMTLSQRWPRCDQTTLSLS